MELGCLDALITYHDAADAIASRSLGISWVPIAWDPQPFLPTLLGALS